MTINLVPMNENAFEEYYRQSLKEYAYEHVRAGNWKEDEAVQNAHAEFEKLLPDGVNTIGHVLFSVMHGEKAIGALWLNIRIKNQEKQAYKNRKRSLIMLKLERKIPAKVTFYMVGIIKNFRRVDYFENIKESLSIFHFIQHYFFTTFTFAIYL